MLARHMAGYAPSLVVTGLVALASLSFFTALLSPAAYGHYALTMTAMAMLVGVCFSWSQNAASRLMPQAVAQGRQAQLLATLYGMVGLACLVLAIVAAVTVAFVPQGDWRLAACFAPPLAMMRGVLNVNQAAHRNFVRIARYNIIEIGQSVVGLGVALLLVWGAHMGASGAVIGTLFGLVVMTLFDWRLLAQIRWRQIDRAMFGDIAAFGLPFIVNFGFSFILASSDRFMIQAFLGIDQVGAYAAAYAFPDRITQYLFMAVATASFPLLVRRLEQEGVEAARDQTYINGIAILALALPACVGLCLANRQIAAVLIGVNFRASAVALMPWIAIGTVMNGLAAHYFDHAFHLAKRTWLFFWTLGPAALLNVVGNFYAIPHYGIAGAAYTTLASYALYLLLSIVIGRRLFALRFPFKPAAQIIAATAVMAAVVLAVPFSNDITGLIGLVVTGGFIYALGLVFFDVMGVRGMIRRRMGGI